jgi:hypothetical protein
LSHRTPETRNDVGATLTLRAETCFPISRTASAGDRHASCNRNIIAVVVGHGLDTAAQPMGGFEMLRKDTRVCLLALSLMGCGMNEPKQPTGPEAKAPKAETGKAETAKSEQTSLEDVQRKAGEAYQAAKKYAFEHKDEYMKEAKAKLAEWQKKTDEQIAKLKAQAKDASGETKAKIDQAISNLEEHKDAVREKYSELEKSTKQAWGNVRDGMEKAFNAMKKSFQEASSHYKS